MNNVNTQDRWIIGGLITAFSAVLWWVLIDTRLELRNTVNTVTIDASRITSIERRADALERAHADLKDDLREHRKLTEPR